MARVQYFFRKSNSKHSGHDYVAERHRGRKEKKNKERSKKPKLQSFEVTKVT